MCYFETFSQIRSQHVALNIFYSGQTLQNHYWLLTNKKNIQQPITYLFALYFAPF